MKQIICSKCNKGSILDASYCISCGNKFTKKEKIKARKGTVVGILETIDSFNNIKSLSIITQNKIFRLVSIVIVLLIGFFNIYLNGSKMKLLENKEYKIEHYKDMYYIIIDKEKTIIDLYIPNKVDHLEVDMMSDDKKLSTEKVELSSKLELESNDEKSYYVINGVGNNGDKLKVKLIYEGE